MPLFRLLGKLPGKGVLALVDTQRPHREIDSQPTSPSIYSNLAQAIKIKPKSSIFSPVSRIATTYRIRSSRLRSNKSEYGPLPGEDTKNDFQLEEDEQDETTYFIDEDTILSHTSPKSNRRRWLVCGLVFCLAILTVLLVLVVLVLTVHAVYDHGDYHDGSSDTILANLGLSGSDSQPPSQYAADFLRDVVPIACHSHNDYWRKVPLFTALHAGCIGTEADVWLVDDDLYVGHDQSALTPNRTLQSLYLDPLMDILERANPSTNASSGISTTPRGVFDMSPNQTLSLLIDVKTDGAATFRKVLEQVEPLRQRGWLSTFDNGKVQLGPITLVGSGNTPFHVVIENSTYRYAFFDAPLDQLEDSMYNSTNSYYSSVGLRQALGIVWFGWFRNSQIERMSEQLQQAHERGLKARYWSLPSWPVQVRDAVWGTLIYEGVDLLNVDDVEAAAHADWTKKKSN